MLGLCARRRLLCSAAKVDYFAVLNVQARATAICPRDDAHDPSDRPLTSPGVCRAQRRFDLDARQLHKTYRAIMVTRATRAARARHSVR